MLGKFCNKSLIILSGICGFIFKCFKCAFYVALSLSVIFIISLFFIDDIVRYAINHSANYMDLNAKVEEVDVNLFTQRVMFKNISIKNPDGFSENDALYATKLYFKFDIFDIKNPVKRIYLQNAKLRVEGRSGRRIMADTFFKSNLYVIAREFSRSLGVKLEKVIYENSKSKSENSSLDYSKFKKIFENLHDIDEVRFEKITIENGDDTYAFSSFIFNDKFAILTDFKSTVFGVKFYFRNIFFDIQKPLFGFSGFSIRNPEGFQKNSVFSIKKCQFELSENIEESGVCLLKIKAVNIDSPTVYFEDKDGSMLGAFGMENNFLGLYNIVNSISRSKLDKLFQDEFETVPDSQEFKMPEIAWGNINISNARIICTKKDAGLLANKISISKGIINIDDIIAHFGGLKLQLDGVKFDSDKQLFTASDFLLKNPDGFPEESAFRFRNFTMTTNFSERVLKGNRVMSIDNIEVNKFFVRLDSRSGKLFDLIGNDNNLYEVLNSVNATTSLMPVYSAANQKLINENKKKRPTKFIINSVKFCDGKIFIGPRGDSIKIPFDDVIKSDVGLAESGLTSQEVTTLLLKDIILNSIDGAESKVSEEIGGVVLAPFISILRVIITLF